jgi:hypothetical protein
MIMPIEAQTTRLTWTPSNLGALQGEGEMQMEVKKTLCGWHMRQGHLHKDIGTEAEGGRPSSCGGPIVRVYA